MSLQNRGGWSAECDISRLVLFCDGQWPASSTTWQSIALVPTAPVLGNVTAAAIGLQHACAISAGVLSCRGDNTRGQLGAPTGATFIPNWLGVASPPPNPAGLTAGWSHTCVFGSNGLLYCWGDNSLGQAGSSTPLMVSAPQTVLGQAGTP